MAGEPIRGRRGDGTDPHPGDARQERPDLGERRKGERRVWFRAGAASLILHVLAVLLWPSGGLPDSPFSAAGAREQDEDPAEGIMRAVALSAAPADPVQPPPVPTFELDVPEPPETEPDATPEIALEEPEIPDPAGGATVGSDDDDEPTGLPGASGAGDAGTGDEGLTRLIPPTPRGMIIPPTNRSLRGTQVEVWVFVDEAGRVVPDSTRLEPPTSDRRFNEQLIREAAQWLFQPARRGSDTVASWFPYTISM